MREADKDFSQDFLIKKLIDAECMLRFCNKQFGNAATKIETPIGAQYVTIKQFADDIKSTCVEYYRQKRKK